MSQPISSASRAHKISHTRLGRVIAGIVPTGALLVAAAVPTAHADTTIDYRPSAVISTLQALRDIETSPDGSTLYGFAPSTNTLVSYDLTDCADTGFEITTLSCETDWTTTLADSAQAWFVDQSDADKPQIFVLTQQGDDAALHVLDATDGSSIRPAITLADHTAHAVTFVPVNNFAYIAADDGVVLVDLTAGAVDQVIEPRTDEDVVLIKPGQRAINYNPFSTGTTTKPTPNGLVYVAYEEYLTSIDVATNTRVETTRRLTTPAGLSPTGQSAPKAATPTLMISGTLSTGTYRTFGISSEEVHGQPHNAVFLYNTLSGGSTSTNAAAWVAKNPVGLGLSTTEDLLFAASDSDNSVAIVSATASGTAAPTQPAQTISLNSFGVTQDDRRDVSGVTVNSSDLGVKVFVANPVSGTVTVLERIASYDDAQVVISGTSRVGNSLTARASGWPEDIDLTYRWYLDGEEVAGETTSSLTLPAHAVSKRVSVAVSGAVPGFSRTVATSAQTSPVAAAELTLGTVTLTGRAQVGSVVSAKPGTWTAGTTLTYQWLRNGQPIPGATSAELSVTKNLVGSQLSVLVTGTKPGYQTASTTSMATGIVIAAAPKTSDSANSSPAKSKKLKAATPAIRGKAVVGAKLSVKKGNWTSGTHFTYRWFVGGKKVSHATNATFKVKKKYVGKRIRVQVTGTKSGYAKQVKKSQATAKVNKRTR